MSDSTTAVSGKDWLDDMEVCTCLIPHLERCRSTRARLQGVSSQRSGISGALRGCSWRRLDSRRRVRAPARSRREPLRMSANTSRGSFVLPSPTPVCPKCGGPGFVGYPPKRCEACGGSGRE